MRGQTAKVGIDQISDQEQAASRGLFSGSSLMSCFRHTAQSWSFAYSCTIYAEYAIDNDMPPATPLTRGLVFAANAS